MGEFRLTLPFFFHPRGNLGSDKLLSLRLVEGDRLKGEDSKGSAGIVAGGQKKVVARSFFIKEGFC